MQRAEALAAFERGAVDTAAARYGTIRADLHIFPDSEGCQNLVYAYDVEGCARIMRVSFRPDRTPAQIEAEVAFVNYLSDCGVGVSRAMPSLRGNLLEVCRAGADQFIVTSFLRGRGMRVPDNGYRYRDDVPIDEYFVNWGRMLGQLHACAKRYALLGPHAQRPDLFEILEFEPVEERVPERLPRIREKLTELLAELRSLSTDRDGYGLIHADFNDGNFTVDYTNGDITVFDFDDCCYGWFAYELACAWEGGVGRVMFGELSERKAFMDRYFGLVLQGYNEENTLSQVWLDRIPFFLRVVQMQELLYFLQYIDVPDEEIQAGLRYKIRCIEDGLPYLGFFDPIYSPTQPFSL